MHIIVFGNYIFAKKLAEILILRKYKITCVHNNIIDDNKYGDGIQDFAKVQKLDSIVVSNRNELLNKIKALNPDFGISAAFKYLIPVEQLQFSVYGIHFGGLYGRKSIRGKNSSIWYRLRQKQQGTITLYRMSENKFDIGKVINEIDFRLGTVEEDTYRQIENYNTLLKPLLDSSDKKTNFNSDISNISSYFPKAFATHYSKGNFTDSELTISKKSKIQKSENVGKVSIIDKKYIFDDYNECYFYEYKNNNNQKNQTVIYLHGFGSIFSKNPKNNKLVKLSILFESDMIVPVLRGINGIYCDGTQQIQEVIEQFHNILSFAENNQSIIICTSISCLILSAFISSYPNLKQVIFVNPMIELSKTSFDDGITDFLNADKWSKDYVELKSDYLLGSKISSDFLRYLGNISMLENLKEYPQNYQVIFSSNDDYIDADYWRKKFFSIGSEVNSINIIDGNHTFRSLLQLYYLACQVRKMNN